MNHVKKAQDQEYKLYTSNTVTTTARTSGPPPAPLLVCRTDTTMVFKPAPYKPAQKVSYQIINPIRSVGKGKDGKKKKVTGTGPSGGFARNLTIKLMALYAVGLYK